MNYTEENNIPGLLLLGDFGKAFDTVSWVFIEKFLNFLNFGVSIQKWITVFKIIYPPLSIKVDMSLTPWILNAVVDKGTQSYHIFLSYVSNI